jgi:hypothetical protein
MGPFSPSQLQFGRGVLREVAGQPSVIPLASLCSSLSEDAVDVMTHWSGQAAAYEAEDLVPAAFRLNSQVIALDRVEERGPTRIEDGLAACGGPNGQPIRPRKLGR